MIAAAIAHAIIAAGPADVIVSPDSEKIELPIIPPAIIATHVHKDVYKRQGRYRWSQSGRPVGDSEVS